MFCNAIVNTVEELNGKRLRISGASWARWAKNFGRLSVAIPVHEVYEVLEQGFVDCTFLSPAELANFNLHDVVKNITTDVPGGLYAAGRAATLNRDPWNRFNTRENEGPLKAGRIMAAYVSFLYQQQADSDMIKAEKKGINILDGRRQFPRKIKRSYQRRSKIFPGILRRRI
jgi:TRAP-type C4-dicarboxylate transport system substrate-binding protein